MIIIIIIIIIMIIIISIKTNTRPERRPPPSHPASCARGCEAARLALAGAPCHGTACSAAACFAGPTDTQRQQQLVYRSRARGQACPQDRASFWPTSGGGARPAELRPKREPAQRLRSLRPFFLLGIPEVPVEILYESEICRHLGVGLPEPLPRKRPWAKQRSEICQKRRAPGQSSGRAPGLWLRVFCSYHGLQR